MDRPLFEIGERVLVQSKTAPADNGPAIVTGRELCSGNIRDADWNIVGRMENCWLYSVDTSNVEKWETALRKLPPLADWEDCEWQPNRIEEKV